MPYAKNSETTLQVRVSKRVRKQLDFIAHVAGFTTSGFVREMCESTMAQDGGARALAFKVRTMDALTALAGKQKAQGELPLREGRSNAP